MPIKLEFYSLEERKPKHYEDIVFLKRSYGFFEEFKPIERTVEYCWFGLDEKGIINGDQYCYSEEIDSENKIGDIITSDIDGSKWILYAIVDGYIMDEDYFWTTSDEYHNSLPYMDMTVDLPDFVVKKCEQALSHVNETPKNEHDSDDVLKHAKLVRLMKQKPVAFYYRSGLVRAEHGIEIKDGTALYAEPTELMRLTDDEIAEFICMDYRMEDEFNRAFKLCVRIMDAMIKKERR